MFDKIKDKVMEKLIYSRPEIEAIEMEVEGVIANSPNNDPQMDDMDTNDGLARNRRRFWNED